MNSARAFAPGNISCIFVIKKDKNPKKAGSLGVGFTVNKGVLATIRKININNKIKTKNGKSIIYFNNKKVDLPTVNSVAKKITKDRLEVKLRSDLPLGYGFGISGASALATSYALNKLLGLKKSRKELAFIAHLAEVENKTGLGDVTNQFYGGFLAKYDPSFKFEVRKLPIKNRTIYYKIFNKIDTKKIISDKKIEAKINNSGRKALKKIRQLNKNKLNPGKIIKISKEFAVNSGLLKNKNLIKIINNIEKNNGNASMIMLGNAVFSDIEFKGSKKVIVKDKGACLV